MTKKNATFNKIIIYQVSNGFHFGHFSTVAIKPEANISVEFLFSIPIYVKDKEINKNCILFGPPSTKLTLVHVELNGLRVKSLNLYRYIAIVTIRQHLSRVFRSSLQVYLVDNFVNFNNFHCNMYKTIRNRK